MGIRILYDSDTWDEATITSSSEASSDLADDNAVDDFVDKPWRSTADNGEWIAFDLGAATQITCFGMFGFNLSASATVTLQADSAATFDSDGGSPEYSQALTLATDSDSNVLKRLVFFLDQTYRYWRVTFEDYLTNPDGYIQVGRIVAGAYYEPPRTMNQDFSVTMADPSEGSPPPGRQAYYRNRNRYRRCTLGMSYTTETQRDKLETIFDKVGNSNPLVLALDPTDRPSKDSMYCYLTTPLGLAHQFAARYNVMQLVFEEKTG